MLRLGSLLFAVCVSLVIACRDERRFARDADPATLTATSGPHVPSTMSVTPMPNEVQVSGAVVENYLGCAVDAACYLRIMGAGQEFIVVYHNGEWPPCANQDTAAFAMTITPGDQVIAFGKAIEPGRTTRISTCDSPTYYISRI